jgi:predicted CopG family antitoxin
MLIYSSTEVKAQEKVEVKEVVNQEITDEQLKAQLYKELLKMKDEGASFSEILNFVMPDREKYISSRTEYLRFMAYSDYLLNQNIERKTGNGTLSAYDIERAEKMAFRKHRNYAEYREWKKTDEAKQLWELGTQDGILKLVVNDLANKTEEEQKRFDGLMKQLDTDNYFKKLVVCEVKGGSRLVIDSPNNFHLDAQDTLKVVESIEVPFSVIDEVPTLKECVDLLTNDERKKCMSNFVSKHVNDNFNTELADSLGITGRQRIFVSFKIDKQGLLKDIRARASHPAFEEEAKRVIKTLPRFIPGRQKGELVVVPYSLPIVFQIVGDADYSKTPNYEKFMDSLSRRKFRLLKELTEQRNRILQNSSQKNPVVLNLNKQIDSLRQVLLESIKKVEVKEIDKTNKNNLTEVPFSAVQVAPVHPDCITMKSQDERKKCTSAAVNTFVLKSFNKEMTQSLGLPDGQQKILAAFTIDKDGIIKKVKSRASHPRLEEEAERVINLLPQFIPGEHKGEKIDVPYSLPIIFELVDDKRKKD